MGSDVSVAETGVCAVDADGEVIRETKVPTEPEAIIAALAAAGASWKLPISLRSTRRPQRGSPIISNAVIRASTVAFPSVGKGPALAGQDDRGSRPHALARCPVRSRRRGCRRHHRAGEGSPSTDHGIRRRDRHTPATTPKPGNTGPGKFWPVAPPPEAARGARSRSAPAVKASRPVQEPDRFGLLDGGMPDRRWTPRNAGRFLGQADSAVAERGSRQSDQPKDRPVTMPRLGLRLTPRRHILLEAAEDAPVLDDRIAERLADAFARGTGHGLLQLGAGEVGQALSPAFVWWRDFAARYVGALCLLAPGAASEAPSSPVLPAVPPPTDGEIATLVLTAPMMPGAEYLNADVLLALWDELGAAFAASLARSGADLQTFLKGFNPAWNLVGRVHFNLAENRHDPELPFAFMATYTTRLSPQAKAQHVPLGQALREYAGAANRDALLSLLVPVQRAAARCGWLKAMVDAGEIFHPLRWSPTDAARFLSSVPDLESAGVVVRMPATWRADRPPRPQVTATVGARPPSAAGLDGLLDFRVDVTLEGEPLTDGEIAALLAGTDTLVLLRGRWVEIDRERLERAVRRFREAQALAERDGLTFAEADAPAGRRGGHRHRQGRRDRRLVARDGRPLAGRDAEGVARPGRRGRRSRPGLERNLAAVPEDGRAMDAPAVRPRPGRLPRRRHGAREDDPGPVAAAGPRTEERGTATEPAGGAGVAARQLGRRDRAVRARPDGDDRAPVGDDGGPARAGHAGRARGDRSGDHQLRHAAARAGAGRHGLAPRRPGRGAGDQEPRRQADQGGQGAQGEGAHRVDRNAGREPPGRSVVDLRFHQPGSARDRPAVRGLRQRAGRAHAQPLRAAAGAGAPLHPAADEDRQVRDRRPAGQDGGHGVLLPQPQAGRALRPDGIRSGRRAGRRRRDSAQGHRPGDDDAPEADLQPSLALARRRRLVRGRQRQVGPPAGDRRRSWRRGRRRCWSSRSFAR